VTSADAPASTLTASVDVKPAAGDTSAVVLVLAGGKANSLDLANPGQLTAVRMRPFAAVLHRRGARHGVAVWMVRYRYRGWNDEQRSPVVDAEWALAEVRRRHGDVPVVLVGHSMGGRAALMVAGDASVRGVCALAPWTVRSDPVAQLVGKSVLVVHGNRDMVTSPRASRSFARHAQQAGARVGYIGLTGEMHAMVFRWRTWHRLAAGFAMGVLGVAATPRAVESAFNRPL
jgi:dienelactone hydrolase